MYFVFVFYCRETSSIWVSIDVPNAQPPGHYEGELIIIATKADAEWYSFLLTSVKYCFCDISIFQLFLRVSDNKDWMKFDLIIWVYRFLHYLFWLITDLQCNAWAKLRSTSCIEILKIVSRLWNLLMGKQWMKWWVSGAIFYLSLSFLLTRVY